MSEGAQQTSFTPWKLQSMEIEAIGPFDRAQVHFEQSGVTLITGQSGTGKTLLLDAIRWAFGAPFVSDASYLRRIRRNSGRISVQQHPNHPGLPRSLTSDGSTFTVGLGANVLGPLDASPSEITAHLASLFPGALDYWSPAFAAGTFRVAALAPSQELTARSIYTGSLDGVRQAPQLAEIFWRFDYLSDSKDPAERELGQAMMDAAKRIASASLIDGGEFSHVKRTSYETMFTQAGQLVAWSSLSSANQHLLGCMLSLLDRMYRLSLLLGIAPAKITEIPGILLIDEVETHLHPAWQKRVLPTVRALFPNVQIIATTHSPFVLASMPGARVYACRQRDDRKGCVVEHIDEDFSAKAVDEILMSRAFEMTQPFSETISRLLRERHEAFERGDADHKRRIERELERLNPEEFSIFSLDERVEQRLAQIDGAHGGE